MPEDVSAIAAAGQCAEVRGRRRRQRSSYACVERREPTARVAQQCATDRCAGGPRAHPRGDSCRRSVQTDSIETGPSRRGLRQARQTVETQRGDSHVVAKLAPSQRRDALLTVRACSSTTAGRPSSQLGSRNSPVSVTGTPSAVSPRRNCSSVRVTDGMLKLSVRWEFWTRHSGRAGEVNGAIRNRLMTAVKKAPHGKVPPRQQHLTLAPFDSRAHGLDR